MCPNFLSYLSGDKTDLCKWRMYLLHLCIGLLSVCSQLLILILYFSLNILKYSRYIQRTRFLAAMSSSRSDDVTKFVCLCVCPESFCLVLSIQSQSCYSANMKYRDKKKPYKYGVIYGLFWGGNTGNYIKIWKMKYRDKKKIKNTGPYTGYFRGELWGNAV